MSRRLNTNARSRQPQLSSAKSSHLKLAFGRRYAQKTGAKSSSTIKNTPRKRKATSISDVESTESEASLESDLDEESDDADDESDEPEVEAPSHYSPIRNGAGPQYDQDSDNLSEAGDWEGFPEEDAQAEVETELVVDEDFERKLFDSDDDLVYERVNDVSDSDPEYDDAALQEVETKALEAEFGDDLTSHFANQIDGMSAYGFGDNSDDDASVRWAFSSSDDAHDVPDRHVHFQEHPTVGVTNAFNMLADSPTMSRALLPSAFPDFGGELDANQPKSDDVEANDYDSDVTEELDAPAEVWQRASARRSSLPEQSPCVSSSKRTPGQKGPIRGTFEDNGDKVTAILDHTGKKLVLSDPHLLGGVFAKRFGPSAPASPSVGFEEAMFGSSDSSQASNSPQPQNSQILGFDLMLPGLTSGDHATTNGQATGLPEAFMPALSQQSNFLNDLAPEIFDYDSGDAEMNLDINDLVAFDDDIDSDDLRSPIGPSMLNSFSAPNTPLPHLAHLNHMNVSAFRRNAESTYFQTLPLPTPLRNKFMTPLKRKRASRKPDSPYDDAHYKGVTPVQRITYQEHATSPAPSSPRMHKRRKTMF